jgi:CDI immunity proteins
LIVEQIKIKSKPYRKIQLDISITLLYNRRRKFKYIFFIAPWCRRRRIAATVEMFESIASLKGKKMLVKFDRNKSLQELENKDWGEPTYDSHLVTTCYKLHRVPLKLFNIENLRIMIGQCIGLEFLVPLALEQLNLRPLAHGDFYVGDLLVALLRVERNFWDQHPDYCSEVNKIVQLVLLMGQKKKKRFGISIELISKEHKRLFRRFY